MGKEAKYVVRLSDEERRQLQAIVDKGGGGRRPGSVRGCC